MAFPLIVLAVGSIFAGYMLSDALIGWGSPFWGTSIPLAPGTTAIVASHMIPVWASWLPLMSVVVGLALALAFTWPMPWCAEWHWKTVYLFLQARWHFDVVWNQFVATPVLQLGAITWAALDKGVLEVLGPRGLTASVTHWALPSIRQWQTGTVHDYALVLQVCVIVGVILLAVPSFWIEGLTLDFRTIALALGLIVFVSSLNIKIEKNYSSLLQFAA